jgi:hypothetical protein
VAARANQSDVQRRVVVDHGGTSNPAEVIFAGEAAGIPRAPEGPEEPLMDSAAIRRRAKKGCRRPVLAA